MPELQKCDALDHIGNLMEEISEATASEKNRMRGKRQPTVNFSLEDPVAWVKLFKYDANRYFSDPLFYFEQTLCQKL